MCPFFLVEYTLPPHFRTSAPRAEQGGRVEVMCRLLPGGAAGEWSVVSVAGGVVGCVSAGECGCGSGGHWRGSVE